MRNKRGKRTFTFRHTPPPLASLKGLAPPLGPYLKKSGGPRPKAPLTLQIGALCPPWKFPILHPCLHLREWSIPYLFPFWASFYQILKSIYDSCSHFDQVAGIPVARMLDFLKVGYIDIYLSSHFISIISPLPSTGNHFFPNFSKARRAEISLRPEGPRHS